MKKFFIFVLTGLMMTGALQILPAADLEFDSFEEAEAAAQKRAAEYQKQMDEHLKQVQSDWEKQQKDLGESDSSPDITKITSSSDGNKSSDTDAQKNMENAVNSSVNDMKDMMIKSATPDTTGFAGGAAGYQWSVKFKDGKYVLSDSYNEAAFGTGDKRDKDPEPATPEPAKDGSGSDEDVDVATKSDPSSGSTSPDSSSSGSPSSTTPSSSSTGSSDPGPKTADANTGKPDSTDSGSSASTGTTPEKQAKKPEKPTPGIDPAPTKLPEPAVRLIVQHPTEFSEEVFSTNANNSEPIEYSLNKFKIPEDTRVKISLELAKDIDPGKVKLVVIDEEGQNAPVSSQKTKNYRHMFRVPSEDQYSAAVVIEEDGKQKQLMKVKIPVAKVEFDSRTIDNQRRKIGDEGSSTSSTSSSTSHSGSDSNYTHSKFGKSEQVDLTDLYSDPNSKPGNSSSESGSSSSQGNSSSANVADSGTSGSDASSSDSYENLSSAQGGTESPGSKGYSSRADASDNGGDEYSDDQSNGSASDSPGSENGDSSSAPDDSSDEYSYDSSESSGGSSSESESDSGGYASASSGDNPDGNKGTERRQGSLRNVSSSGNSGDSYGDDVADDNTNRDDESGEYASDSHNQSGENRAAYRAGDGTTEAKQGSAQIAMGSENVSDSQKDQDEFVMALSMQVISKKIYQSFDFIDEKSPVSATIPKGAEITFSMSFANDVSPESVSIELVDGGKKIGGTLKTWGEAFAYVFESSSNAQFIIKGKSSRGDFNYALNIPIQ